MKFLFSASLLVSVVLFAAPPVQPGATFFENDQVKVLRALEKPHVKGKAHEHKANRVMVYLQSGRQRFEYRDGRKPETFDWKAGDVKWNPANGVHAPEVLTDEPFNIVEVELKNKGLHQTVKGPLDPAKIDPKHYTIEFENDQVRVLRVRIGPHEVAPLHEHGLNRVTILLTDQNFRVTTKDGKVDTIQKKAGDVTWGTPLIHKEENLSDSPFEVIAVEIKG
jgi:quercetin dioxygenase-like cupin family protein